MPGAGNAKDCYPQIFRFYTKKRDLVNLFDQFHSTVLFSIFRFVCIELVALIWVKSSDLSCHLCLWYYDQLVLFNKEIHANVYRHSLWEYSKTFPLFIWMAFDTSYDIIYQNLY